MAKLNFGAHPFMLGFDQLDQLLEKTEKSASDGFPPYNIVKSSQNEYRISIAVAGYSSNELEVMTEGRQLAVRGKRREADVGKVFLCNGIASRKFRRNFVLAEGMEITGAQLENGLLHIDLFRRTPDERVQKIEIATL